MPCLLVSSLRTQSIRWFHTGAHAPIVALSHAQFDFLLLLALFVAVVAIVSIPLAFTPFTHLASPALHVRSARFELDFEGAAGAGAISLLDVAALLFDFLALGRVVGFVGVVVLRDLLDRRNALAGLVGHADGARVAFLRARDGRAHAAAEGCVAHAGAGAVVADELCHCVARALAAADAEALLEVLGEARDEQTALAVGTRVPRDVARGLAAGVELDLLRVAAHHIRVLRPGGAHALLFLVLLLLLDELALLLALCHVRRERVAVHVVPGALHPRVQHAVLLGEVRVLHALAHDGVHEARQLAVRTYYLRCRLERVPLEEYGAVLVLGGGRLGNGYRRRGGAAGVLLLRLRLEGGQGERLGLRGGGLHAQHLLGAVA
jgi:hypothetical protein